jgi:hypothetical protein
MKHHLNHWIFGLRLLAAVLLALACIGIGLRLLAGFESLSAQAGFRHPFLWSTVDFLFLLIALPFLVFRIGRGSGWVPIIRNTDA